MSNHELDRLRFEATEVENHYIDEYMAGRISRQRLLQLGTGIGMSLPLLGMFGTASALASPKSSAGAKAGGTLRVGSLKAADRHRSRDERHAGDARRDEHHRRVPRLRRARRPGS